MAFEIRLDRSEAAAVITIDNPPVNTLHPAVAEVIAEKVAVVGADEDIRALVITGSGRHFVAGGDIEYFKSLDRRLAERYVLGIQKMQDDLTTLPVPVIAALNGTTLGGGCELAMACDIRVAERQVVLGQPEVGLGLIPGAGGTQALPRLVPLGRAKRLLFTGERISADEALEIGLVDEVVGKGEALNRSLDLAAAIAKNAPLAVTAAKRAVTLGMQMSFHDANRLEAALFASLVETSDFREGISAFLEKRKPTFESR